MNVLQVHFVVFRPQRLLPSAGGAPGELEASMMSSDQRNNKNDLAPFMNHMRPFSLQIVRHSHFRDTLGLPWVRELEYQAVFKDRVENEKQE